jgi:hypothetical protein
VESDVSRAPDASARATVRLYADSADNMQAIPLHLDAQRPSVRARPQLGRHVDF